MATFIINPTVIRNLSKLNQFKSTFAIILEWFLIAIPIWLLVNHWNWWLYPLLVMWVASRQHALGILMHEGAHYRLFKNKFLNDYLSSFFLAWPLGIDTRAFRENHAAHHRYNMTELDPDWFRKNGLSQRNKKEWHYPKKLIDLFLLLFKDLIGFNFRYLFGDVYAFSIKKNTKFSLKTITSSVYTMLRLFFYMCAFLTIMYFNAWYLLLLYWFIPMLTWLTLSIRIRSIAEHFSTENTNIYNQSRTTYPNIFERLFIAPVNVNYHLDHHLYPSVPFYNLPTLHKELLKNELFLKNAHITKTYFGVLKESLIKN